MDDEITLQESIFRVGNVISVEGRYIKVKVFHTKNSSNIIFNGEIQKNISVGGYVKICKGFIRIIGKVDGEYIEEEKTFPQEYQKESEKICRILKISLLGYFEGDTFRRGIKELPLINNECYLLENDEFNKIHHFVDKDDEPISLGSLSFEKGQEINVGVNSLFASHIGIFGNTGSGKSYTLAKIYRELFLKYKDNKEFKDHTQFFFIDFSGEYSGDKKDSIIEKQYKDIFRLSTRLSSADKYALNRSSLDDISFWTIFLDATEKTQTPFLNRVLKNDFIKSKVNNSSDLISLIKDEIINATTKEDRSIERGDVINYVQSLSTCLTEDVASGFDKFMKVLRGHLQFHTKSGVFYYQQSTGDVYANNPVFKQIISREISNIKIDITRFNEVRKFELRIILNYFREIFLGYDIKEFISPLINRLNRRIKDLEKVIKIEERTKTKNLTIISLKDVNIDMKKILPLLFCKNLYENKKQDSEEKNYLNIVIDEAHNILSSASERESQTWKDYRLETFEEIIKEGRKFGVFLTIASQRPADISSTIISQLHNYFLHRLINNNDILAVEKTISYLDKVSFDYIPILPTGTCILAGQLAQVPVIIDIGQIEDVHEPESKTIDLVSIWNK